MVSEKLIDGILSAQNQYLVEEFIKQKIQEVFNRQLVEFEKRIEAHFGENYTSKDLQSRMDFLITRRIGDSIEAVKKESYAATNECKDIRDEVVKLAKNTSSSEQADLEQRVLRLKQSILERLTEIDSRLGGLAQHRTTALRKINSLSDRIDNRATKYILKKNIDELALQIRKTQEAMEKSKSKSMFSKIKAWFTKGKDDGTPML